MTEDYKEILLKYLTGNLSEEDKNLTLNYAKLTTTDTTSILSDTFYVRGYVEAKDINGKPNGKTIVYGYIAPLSDRHSFIAIFQGDTLLAIKEEYNTGTDFGFIYTLEADEKGQLYGVEYFNEKPRFIMLNNISESDKNGNYQVILRQSYYLQGNVREGFEASPTYGVGYAQFFLGKSPQSATYVILLLDYNSGATSMVLSATNLVINVGEANEWNDYTLSVSMDGGSVGQGQGKYIYFDKDDNPHFEIYIVESSTNSLNVYKNTDYVIDIKETVYSSISTTIFGENGHWYTEGGTEALMINIAPNYWYWFVQGYIGSSYSSSKRKCIIIRNANGVKQNCFVLENDTAGSYIDPYCVLRLINNIPMMYVYFPVETGSNEAEQYIGFIPDPNSEDNLIKKLPNCRSDKAVIVLINNAFNMYDFVSLYKIYNTDHYEDKNSKWQVVYNPNNYNNEPYENINSLIPNNGLLFDANNNLIFARNLYNYKTYNNRTISVLNVPNTYLNDVSISSKTILSETNTEIFDNTEAITKNIYEDLYLNFFTTLNMVNKNEPIYIENKGGAIRLNQSISKDKDYLKGKASKVLITYTDGSSFKTSTSATITNGVATYELITYIPSDKNIQKIDILSEDENTIYQTITNETITSLNLQNNKYYKITQDVHIE